VTEHQGSDSSDSVVMVNGIDAGYGGVQILHQVSMTARTGDVTCIFGPNGCGKSTLLKAMAGVIDPWAGTITIDDDDLTHLHRIAPSAAGSR
jgi:branched-chain amino acid transport system ATP-binding protein